MAISTVAATATDVAAAAASIVMNTPTGTQSGDLMIIAITYDGPPTTSPQAAGFWILYKIDKSATHRAVIYYRICDGSEAASYTFNVTPNAIMGGVAVTFRGVDLVTPFDKDKSFVSATASSVDCPSITTDKDNSYLVMCCCLDSATATMAPPASPGTWTEEAEAALGRDTSVHTTTFATAGATGTVSATMTGGPKNLLGIMFALNPDPGTPYQITRHPY